MATFNFKRVESEEYIPSVKDKRYQPILSNNIPQVLRHNELMSIIDGLYQYGSKDFKNFGEMGTLNDEERRGFFETKFLSRDVNALYVYLHYWPQAFTYDLLKELEGRINSVEEVYSSFHDMDEINVEIARTKAKIRLTIENFSQEWIKEDYYNSLESHRTTDPRVLEA